MREEFTGRRQASGQPGGDSESREAAYSHPTLTPVADIFPSISSRIKSVIERGDKKLVLIFSDVDGTLSLGRDVAGNGALTRDVITKARSRGVILVPITGSHYSSGTISTPSIEARIKEGCLPTFASGDKADSEFAVDAYATDGGAILLVQNNSVPGGSSRIGISPEGPSYVRDYQSFVNSHRFDYEKFIGRSLLDLMDLQNGKADRLHSMVFSAETVKQYDPKPLSHWIEFQPGTAEGLHRTAGKIAFYFYANSIDDRDAVESYFKVRFPGAQVVCCEERDANTKAREWAIKTKSTSAPLTLKYCLDLVPFHKGTPVSFMLRVVREELFRQSNEAGKLPIAIEAWFCGDAGNDLVGMQSDGITHVVMVGGSSPELLRQKASLEDMGRKVYTESEPTMLGPASILKAFEAMGLS